MSVQAAPTGVVRDKIQRRDETIAFAIMTTLLLIAPLTIYPVFLMQALCFALFACAFNLLIGYGGLLSLGHAMFLGMAGYVAAHMATHGTIDFHLTRWFNIYFDFGPTSPEVAILCGTAVALALGAVVGVLAIRRQGIYFAMITLALAQMVYFFCLQASFTGGESGIQIPSLAKAFGVLDLTNQKVFYYFVLAIFLVGFLFVHRIVNSPFGDVLKAIRENEPRMISLGYKVDYYKLTAFILSAGLAGLAGATKALVVQGAALTDVYWSMSGIVVLMTLLGGLGTMFGPVVGAFIILSMQDYLAGFGQWVTVIQGAIFVICVLALRRGVVGEFAHKFGLSL